ncbi:MAG: MMPL family transporter [Methanocorpusculum sp.]|nr:MMPL family transporter [Methanocorpusculum sp.]
MINYADLIIKKRKGVIAVVLLIALICVFLMTQVSVNYNMVDYLPDQAGSTTALTVLDEEYPGGVPNARVMVYNITIPEALELKEKIAAVEGVNEVLWLDDAVSLEVPIESLDKDTVNDYYINTTALYTLTLDETTGRDAVKVVKAVVGENSAMSGMTVSSAFSSDTMGSDLQKILLIAFPIILIILIFTTKSWFEPLLFLFTIGVAILINMGTNIIFGEISFVTKGIAALLQLAIAIDYAIFLLHRFNEYRTEGMEVKDAMALAMKKSALSIWSSGLTAGIGFAALIAMRLGIGPDLGFVMVKAILISLICVFTILPAMTVCCHKLIEKTQHRSLVPNLRCMAKPVRRFCIPFLIITLIILVPSVLAVANNDYIYFDLFNDQRTIIGQDMTAIKEEFGDFSSLVLMVGNDNPANERSVLAEIEDIPIVTSVISYSKTVGTEIPEGYVPPDTLSEIVSPNYTRYVVTVNSSLEAPASFAAIETLRAIGEKYYPGNWYLAGEIANAYDMKTCVKEDDIKVNLIAVGGIFLVLLFVFRSISVPVILVLVIESAIWINCGMPYFQGGEMFYITRMVIFALQLGATVDYAILFASRYFENRRECKKKEALENTLATAAISILTSAAILFACGAVLWLISSSALLSEVGLFIARGALLSVIAVLFVLPAILLLCDRVIQKTSLKMKFVPDKKGVSLE